MGATLVGLLTLAYAASYGMVLIAAAVAAATIAALGAPRLVGPHPARDSSRL
jgi:hypothetical protein